MNKLKFFIKENLSILTIIILFVIVYGGSVYFLNKKLTETQKQIQNLQNNIPSLEDGTVKSLAKKVDDLSSLEDELKKYSINLDLISKDLEKLSVKLNSFTSVQTKTPGGNYYGLPSSRVSKPTEPVNIIKCDDLSPCPDPFGHLTNKQYFNLFEPFDNKTIVPFGEVSFETWKKNPWSFKVLPREYQVVTMMTEQSEDSPPLVYNQFKIKVDNKEFILPISKTETVFIEKNKKFRIKPNIFLGFSAGASVNNSPNAEMFPFIEASVFEYGKEGHNPTWAFLGIAAGLNIVENSFAVGVSPFQYNIAEHLPLINNLYIGPQINFSTDESISVLGSFKVKL